MVRSPTRLLLTRTAANVPILSSPSCFLDMLGYFLDHLHLGVLLNDGSMGGSEPEETRKSADEVSHTNSVWHAVSPRVLFSRFDCPIWVVAFFFVAELFQIFSYFFGC